MKEYFTGLGFNVKIVDIHWNNRVMSDYVQQFRKYYERNKTETNYVLGFSYGAMITLISAPELKPDKIYLCSLSPYFNEDLKHLKPAWKKFIGQHRFNDFSKFSADKITTQVTAPTIIFYGGAEAAKYPRLKHRCEQAAQSIKGAKLVIAPNAPHDISHPTYIQTIKSI
jgi:pimeloyl-ACP methyl ester carboxylesterase